MSTVTSVDDLLFDAPASVAAKSSAPTLVAGTATDHQLIHATCVGDETAFAELVARYRHPITNYLYRLTNDYDAAVDLAQETFMRVFRHADRYQASHAFSTYIYHIATNLAISELRRRKRRRLISLSAFFQSSEAGGEATDFDVADARPLQDSTLIEDERQRAVTRAIASLPEKYRAPLVLRDVEGKSYDEIATILAMSDGTVKSRISRARALLREKLQTYL